MLLSSNNRLVLLLAKMQNREVTRGGRRWATNELTLLVVDVLLQGMGMQDLAIDELRQGMEVGRHLCWDEQDGGSYKNCNEVAPAGSSRSSPSSG
jgi:hypothetical protein